MRLFKLRTAIVSGVVVCLLLAVPGSALAAPGDLDASFGTAGKVTTDFGTGGDSANAVAVQADGKTIAAGYCSVGSTLDFCLTRYGADGSLDTSFDGDGKVTTAVIASSDQAFAVAIQADGKVVAAGTCWTGSVYVFCLARYNGNGSLDTSFDGDGKVTTAIGAGYAQAEAVAVQGDGKIVVAGYCAGDFCLARYNGNGSLDASFDGDGKVTTEIGASDDFAVAVAVQSDGKIVVAGYCSITSYDFCLARYDGSGSLDASFDGDGKVTTGIGTGGDLASGVAVQADGKIVAAGSCWTGSNYDFCLARYNGSGSLDTSFDGDGKVTTAIGTSFDLAQGVAVQADGKIVAGGYCVVGSTFDVCLASYTSGGSLDTSFGGDGTVTTAIGTDADQAHAVAVQADGKIVAAGRCFAGSTSDFCLARHNGDGSLDASWDSDGRIITPIGAGDNLANAVAVQADGKLVAAGSCWTGFTLDFCLTRYKNNGSLDTSFYGNGKVVTAVGSSDDRATAVAVQGDGKIATAGSCWTDSTWDFCLARHNGDGTLDASFDSDGRIITPIGAGDNLANAVAVQADGKIVAAGGCFIGSTYDFCLALYNSDGGLDTSFDGDGKVVTAVGSSDDRATAVAVQGDGKIVAAGGCFIGSTYDFCLARYNSDGGPDTSFDGDGKVTTGIGTGGDLASGVAVQADGKIVAAGSCWTGSNYDFCLARYNGSGSLDTSFDGDGKVTTAIGTAGGVVKAVAVQSDGKIVAAGYCGVGLTQDFCLTRYNGDGSLDMSFDGDGKVTTAMGASADFANAAAVQPDGRIVAAGHCSVGLASIFCLARYAGTPILPGAPTGLTATAQSRSQIVLSWTDNAMNETGFRIERSLDGSSGWRQIATVGANVTSYVHSRQPPLTTFYYRVRATNATGDSAYSNIASATTLGW